MVKEVLLCQIINGLLAKDESLQLKNDQANVTWDTRQYKRGTCKTYYLYFDEVNADPVIFHWKYNLNDIDVSEEVIVDTLPLKKSS